MSHSSAEPDDETFALAGKVHALTRWAPSLGLAPPMLPFKEQIATTHAMLVFTSVVWATGVGD